MDKIEKSSENSFCEEKVKDRRKLIVKVIGVIVFILLQMLLIILKEFVKIEHEKDGAVYFIKLIFYISYAVSFAVLIFWIEDHILMKQISLRIHKKEIKLMDLICMLMIVITGTVLMLMHIEGFISGYSGTPWLRWWGCLKYLAPATGVVTLINSHHSKSPIAKKGGQIIIIGMGVIICFIMLMCFLGASVFFA
jgi:hypothetical protein